MSDPRPPSLPRPVPQAQPDEIGTAAAIAEVHRIVDRNLLDVTYQPIVDLRTRSVFGFEALGRIYSRHFRKVPDLLEAASRAGRVGELGRIFREKAIRGCPKAPLFFNLYPDELDYGWLVRPDDPLFHHRDAVFLEITEWLPLSRFEQCFHVIEEIREKGVRVVIDDFGAGYSNIKYISDLKPHLVKLDRELVAGVEVGTRPHRLIASIVELCRSMGSEVVAEGVETPAEMRAAAAANVHLLQGYLFARPAKPPPDPVWIDETTEEFTLPLP